MSSYHENKTVMEGVTTWNNHKHTDLEYFNKAVKSTPDSSLEILKTVKYSFSMFKNISYQVNPDGST